METETRTMKIDIHTHILPERWPNLRERYGYGGWIHLDHHRPGFARMMQDERFFREIEANCWSPERRIEECDRLGIDMQVLCTVPVMFGYWAPAADALDLARLLNDHIADVCQRYPRRFLGLASVPLQDPALAAEELRRAVVDLGMVGVQIGSHINTWNLDEDALDPFYAAAQEVDAAILVHPWDMMGKERMPRHWLPWLVGMPAETSLAMCSVLMGGVLERFPRLRFCFAHGGGSFPGTLARIEHGFHVRPDLCQTRTKKPPSAYLDRIFIDSIVHDLKTLDFVLDRMGEDQMLLGSDYPFPLGELEPGTMIEAASLKEQTKDKLRWRNASRWLGRPLQQV